MTNEEFEKELKRIEQVVTELRNKLLERKVNKTSYEVEVPEDIDDYIYINNVGEIFDLNTFTVVRFKDVLKRGLTFKTREQAKKYDKERILLFKLHKWAEEQNGGWTPNWKNEDEIKYFIIYDNRYETLKVDNYATIKEFCKLPYFKSEEIAEQFIEEFGDEIKEVLC